MRISFDGIGDTISIYPDSQIKPFAIAMFEKREETNRWHHIAVASGGEGIQVHVDGVAVKSNPSLRILFPNRGHVPVPIGCLRRIGLYSLDYDLRAAGS